MIKTSLRRPFTAFTLILALSGLLQACKTSDSESEDTAPKSFTGDLINSAFDKDGLLAYYRDRTFAPEKICADVGQKSPTAGGDASDCKYHCRTCLRYGHGALQTAYRAFVNITWATEWTNWGLAWVVDYYGAAADVIQKSVGITILKSRAEILQPLVRASEPLICASSTINAFLDIDSYIKSQGENKVYNEELAKLICALTYQAFTCKAYIALPPHVTAALATASTGCLLRDFTVGQALCAATRASCLASVDDAQPIANAHREVVADKTYPVKDCCVCNSEAVDGGNIALPYASEKYCEDTQGVWNKNTGYTNCHKETLITDACSLTRVELKPGRIICHRNRLEIWDEKPSGRFIETPPRPPFAGSCPEYDD